MGPGKSTLYLAGAAVARTYRCQNRVGTFGVQVHPRRQTGCSMHMLSLAQILVAWFLTLSRAMVQVPRRDLVRNESPGSQHS